MKNQFVFLVLLFGLSNLSVFGQYSYKKIPIKYLNRNLAAISQFNTERSTFINKGFDLTELLPANFVKDGSVDYTTYIQLGLNKYNNVIFPDFPLLINEKGLTVNSNSNLVFRDRSRLIMKPNNLTAYEVIRLHNVKNINIFNAVVVGDRDQHRGTTGQQGIGIAIRSSTNVKLINPRVSKCWGDGIYVGQIKNIRSENVAIYNAKLDENRRNGVSITCGLNIRLYNPTISNTNGTLPMYGIDIEPNSNEDVIDNILIENPITYNNSEGGIVIGLGKLVGKKKKNVNVTIKNHIDEDSKVGFYMGGILAYAKKPGEALIGKINIINPKWIGNIAPFKSRLSFDRAPLLQIEIPSILNPKRPAFTVSELKHIVSSNRSIIIK